MSIRELCCMKQHCTTMSEYLRDGSQVASVSGQAVTNHQRIVFALCIPT